MQWIILGTIISYLIGSIPTAYLFGRMLKGIDIRKFGSGNVGATNALRVLGRGPGVAVLILDIFKGFAVVYFIGNFISSQVNYPGIIISIAFGIVAIIGHNWTVFLNFKGGKGIATTLGVLIGLTFSIAGLGIILGITILVWLVVFLVSRIVSLASIAAALSLPLVSVFFKQDIIILALSVLLCCFVILRHRANIQRLFKGKETKISFRKK